MIALFEANDKVSQARFLEFMTHGLEPVRDPERYAQLLEAKTALEEFIDTTEDGSEEHRAANVAIANVTIALTEYEKHERAS